MAQKILDGKELQNYIKERQSKQVQKLDFIPRLVIIAAGDDPLQNKFIELKQSYAADIGVDVRVDRLSSIDSLSDTVVGINNDEQVQGVIIQLPVVGLDDPQRALDLIDKSKDIDGLGKDSDFDSASATAIEWLLAGHNITLDQGKKIVIVGRGKLVGGPLFEKFKTAEYNVEAMDETSFDPELIAQADVIISATGVPNIITPDLVKDGATVIDAGTTSLNGQVVGDVSEEVRARKDIKITPKIGGVGPLTIAVLFDNLINSLQNT